MFIIIIMYVAYDTILIHNMHTNNRKQIYFHVSTHHHIAFMIIMIYWIGVGTDRLEVHTR